jgi:ribosome-binding factor A
MQSNKRRRDGTPHDSGSYPHDNLHAPAELRGTSDQRKIRQLCRQVQQQLELALGGDFDDPALALLWVVDVQPEPGGAALLVTVVAPDDAELEPIRSSLESARGRLRSEVASAITRKRTPHLRFAVIPERALLLGGGDRDA